MMMRLSSIKYFIQEGFNGLLNSRLMIFASISTVAACVFIIILSFCVVGNIQFFLTQIEDTMGISVFLEDNISAQQITDINETIKNIENVENVEFVSKEDALENVKNTWEMPEILDGFDSSNNPFSNAFSVNIKNLSIQEEIIAELEQIQGIRNIQHSQDESKFLISINNILTVFGILIILVLAILSVVIIINTIKISVYTRKNEINIMKYVGATDWFIRWPFVIEGIFIGFIGSIIPILISWSVYDISIGVIYNIAPLIENVFTFKTSYDIFSSLTSISIFSGISLGVIGSMYSIHKYLKV